MRILLVSQCLLEIGVETEGRLSVLLLGIWNLIHS